MRKRSLTKLTALALSAGLIVTSSAAAVPTATVHAEDTPPDLPSGDSAPNSAPDGNGGGEMPSGSGGNSSSSVTLSAAYTADGEAKTYDGTGDSTGLVSTSSDENVVLATNGGSYTLTNALLNKTGDTTSEDNSNFYAVNAILAAAENSSAYITDSTLTSVSEGSNGIFATGSNAVIYANNVTINTSGSSSRGLDATYEGTIVASDITVTTQGDHCGAIATDRGGGFISVDSASLSTAGQGSPVLYSTGTIEVNNVTGEATGAQIVGMEGLNTVRIKNSTLTGSAKKASEPVANGVILYQSTSGDSSEGTAIFEASDSTLKSYVTDGAMFYVTNTEAEIVLSNTTLDFDTTSNTLLTVGGNDGSNGWGSVGSNGGTVTFTAIDETLTGNLSCDGISTIGFYLAGSSAYTGTVINDTTYTGDGGVSVYLASDTTWIVTADTTLLSLAAADGAVIRDADGNTVTIQLTDGTVLSQGSGSVTITTGSYGTKYTTSDANTISDFTIDRTAYETWVTEGTVSDSSSNSSDTTDGFNTTDSSDVTDSSNTTDSSDTESVSAPAKTKIKSAAATKKKVTLKWKKVSDSTGYVVYRAAKKNGTYKVIADTAKTSYRDTSIKKNKKYFYVVQTYTTSSDGTIVYGNKSKIKKVKTKK